VGAFQGGEARSGDQIRRPEGDDAGEHYPFWSKMLGAGMAVRGVRAFAQFAKRGARGHTQPSAPGPIGPWTFFLTDNTMAGLFLAVAWGQSP
jgi:hypothetical protein